MTKPLTLNEVLTFSEGMELGRAGLSSPFAVFALALIGMAIGLFFLSFLIPRAGNNVLFLLLSGGCLWLFFGMTPSGEQVQAHKAKELEWEREYAQVYINQLPVNRIENIQQVKYDYELEVSQSDLRNSVESRVSKKPVTVTMAEGKKQSFWAEVIYREELESPYIEYRYLDAELKFQEHSTAFKEKGYQQVKLYTNKPISGT